ncbi:SSU-rRNA maturation protein Tsr4 homolog 1 Tsr401 [Schizosaccharomyces pombe]|uniref:Probable uS5 assembly chaperone tsr401 n=1 Tax=Schizosaccharomyces pombe (strain 972 / ATCC 24843) TaxID=284812 RepID=TSR4A_SCHPO|nr:20S rRNA accumulation protein 4 [Schizosaccharomyces pombe]P87156.1 RecName: Full=Probable 20S rRNA accumulation protein 4 [Schizosaccharomyces pombe 972h-]CAB08774.1 SSU-rRNA maturation protein Tsr4 homolog 1 (predicted) [Schizosaccharomyces pombe]|eukprot:NP_596352.1 20S rRNA accumulation protein 4 [Schizosaccharomyces pombe]
MSQKWVQTQAWLGFPDVPISQEDKPDEYSTFLGGFPVFFDGCSLNPNIIKCGNCKNLCRLLLQCYAPLEGDNLKERALYVWGCHNPSCRRVPNSIVCVRGVRLPLKSDIEAVKSPKAISHLEEKKSSPKEKKVNPFAITSESSRGLNPFSDATSANNPFSLSTDVNPSKPSSNVFSKPSFAAKAQQSITDQQKTQAKTKTKHIALTTSGMSVHPPVTETYTYPVTEAFQGMFLGLDLEYVPQNKVNSKKDDFSTFKNYTPYLNDSSEAWEKESYEKSPSVYEKTFRLFSEKISHNPTQCLRYERGGTPLLASGRDKLGQQLKSVTNFGKSPVPLCPLCKSPRLFEMQLMPHAISILNDEIAEWSTILVATCSMDCNPPINKDRVGYAVEWVGIQWD